MNDSDEIKKKEEAQGVKDALLQKRDDFAGIDGSLRIGALVHSVATCRCG